MDKTVNPLLHGTLDALILKTLSGGPRHGYAIARWSHRMMRLSRALRIPKLYVVWARTMLRLYQSVTWSQGRLGRLFDRLMPQPER